MALEFGAQKEKEYFIENFVMLCESGMDILTALSVIRSEVRSPSLKRMLANFQDAVNAGASVSSALEKTRLFKPHIISLIRLGEQSGKLFENLTIIAQQQKRERAFQAKIASALMYPVFIFSVSALVGIGVAWFILPNLATVFSQLSLELPPLTRILIGLGIFLKAYGVIVIPAGIIAFIGMIYLLFFFSPTRWIGHVLLLGMPGIGKMLRDSEVTRMSYILGSLLQAGVPILDALSSLRDTASFFVYRRFYEFLRAGVEKGHSLQMNLDTYRSGAHLIPRAVQQMIIAGEQSGRLAETFLKVSDIFEEKTENTTKNIAVIIEPVLLFIVWIAVVAVALAVILPIYSLIGGLNR